MKVELKVMSLIDIFLNHTGFECDKWLCYFYVYEEYFQRFKNKPDLNILEIGVREGGSLEIWSKYFDSKVNLYGIDINPKCRKIEQHLDNTTIFIGDSGNANFLNSIKEQIPKMDIIIDDGGHMTSQQTIAFNKLFPHLNENGIYICEDTHTNYWTQQGKKYVDTETTFIELIKGKIDQLTYYVTDGYNRRFGLPRMEKDIFADQVSGIHFHDSIIIIEKKQKDLEIHKEVQRGERKL